MLSSSKRKAAVIEQPLTIDENIANGSSSISNPFEVLLKTSGVSAPNQDPLSTDATGGGKKLFSPHPPSRSPTPEEAFLRQKIVALEVRERKCS